MRKDKIQELNAELNRWFHHLHQHPETSMHEEKTSAYISQELKAMGYEVIEGIGKYGMVAKLKRGNGTKSLGIRADFDALAIPEDNNLDYKSTINGLAHLCGHDAHSTMLLGAAKYLMEYGEFDGTLNLIFQPGEETMEGAPAMIADGLFDKFPMDAVFAMHNMPGLEKGKFFFREGEMMAAVDNWEIVLTGKGAHGSTPELGIDPIVAGSSLVMALQSIVSRNVSPWKNSVITVGAFLAGSVPNAVAHTATLRLSVRNMDPELRTEVLNRIRTITKAQAEAFGCTYTINEGIAGAVLVNTPEYTQYAAEVARKTFGEEQVVIPSIQYMGSEDFAFMLQEKPGCYLMIGNGETPMVHHPKYTFSSDLLERGVTYWVALVEDYLK